MKQIPGSIHRRPALRWLWPLKIAVTAFALIIIIRAIPWRDRATLIDGTRVTIMDRQDQTWLVRLEDSSSPNQTIHSGSLQSIEPGVRAVLSHAEPPWLVAYFGCMVLLAALLIGRWRWLMSGACDTPSVNTPSMRWCAVIWARSQVINFLPLSQIGGDLYRIQHSSHHLKGAATATGIIAIERITGFVALLTVALTGLAWAEGTVALVTPILVVIAVIVVINLKRLPAAYSNELEPSDCSSPLHSCRRWLRTALAPVTRLVRRPKQCLGILSVSIAIHLVTSLSFVTVDRALALETPAWCYLVAVPAVVLATFLPIHIAGIGILEGGLWLLLHHWTVRSPAEVISLCATARCLSLAWLALLATSFLAPCRDVVPSTAMQEPSEKALSRWNSALPATHSTSHARVGIVRCYPPHRPKSGNAG